MLAALFTAGQKTQERLYEASITVPGWQVTVPCTHTEIINDVELVPGGRSPKTYIDAVTFRAELLPAGDIPYKNLKFSLDLGDGATVLDLQFWHGGLMPGGFVYKFMAVDANYSA